MNYSAARAELKSVMDNVCDDNETVVISRSGGSAVVMISLDEYNAQKETNYLLHSPRNVKRLRDSIDALNAGDGVEFEG
ncbi:type II toxin-antitoxin system prevent-host-death family antitoxin [Cognatishimia sp. 1_MG-2023]|nr:type II toxin-antitoxin system prevent-host-death family antitoxin [Cognatishimia sp. 1_MG-2023]MDO6726623.1 type II toxin-antitoxin system prevent-host-death family antitoxin [Cognatishimia sp. 1_MG-2023]